MGPKRPSRGTESAFERIARLIVAAALVVGAVEGGWADTVQGDNREAPGGLKKLSLEQLSKIEVTTVSKEPVTIARTPAAVYVLTEEDIQRSDILFHTMTTGERKDGNHG